MNTQPDIALLQQPHYQYPCEREEQQGRQELNGRHPFLKEEGQLFGTHSPVCDSKDDQKGHNEHRIVKQEIRERACFQGRDIRHEQDGGKIDLTRAGKFQKRDDKPG